MVLPLSGQNLVYNGGFETTSLCPDDKRQIKLAVGWFNPFGTPDLMATCATDTDVQVPQNFTGMQESFEGANYAHIAMHISPSSVFNYEFISSRLVSSLHSGTRYCIAFALSLADTSAFAMNKIGVAFTEGPPQTPFLPHWLPFQFESADTFLLDNQNTWMRIEGTFIADNDANYITIGQFNHKDSLNIVQVKNNGTDIMAYYIDDVSLFSCHEDILVEIPNIFTPNNDGINDFLDINIENAATSYTQIFNRWGSLVFESSELSPIWDGNYNGNPVAAGVYFVVVQATDLDGNIITEKQAVHLKR